MIEKQLQDIITRRYHKKAEECGSEELYYSLLELTKEITKERGYNEGERKLYYISAEFLIGKLLSNNLINLGLFEEVREILEKFGKSIEEVEAAEPEPEPPAPPAPKRKKHKRRRK